MSDIFEEARQRHEQNVSDFGIPDRFIDGNDEKLVRVRGLVFGDLNPKQLFRPKWKELLMVTDEAGNIIGTAQLFPVRGNCIEASATLAYNTPQRLDLENGLKMYFTPVFNEDTGFIEALGIVETDLRLDSRYVIEVESGVM